MSEKRNPDKAESLSVDSPSPYECDEIWQKVGQITIAYPLLECRQCAVNIARWLQHLNLDFQILRIKTRRRSESFMISSRCDPNESITENGTHYGVEVYGKVFDNISSEGLSRKDWISDFKCPSGRFMIEEVTMQALLSLEHKQK